MRRVVALALLLAGCDGGGQAVNIGWSFGAENAGCVAAGVQTVHVFIGPLGAAGFYDQEVRCEIGNTPARLTAHGVAPGPHVLVLKGIAHDKTLFYLEQDIDVPSADGTRFELPAYLPP